MVGERQNQGAGVKYFNLFTLRIILVVVLSIGFEMKYSILASPLPTG